jgi:ATP sulfurylase
MLADAKQRAVELPELVIDATATAELSLISCGAYSPIKGFVNGKDYLRVVNEARLEDGIPWAIPIVLPIDQAAARALKGATEVALRNPERELVGLLTVQDIFETNPELEAERLLGTTDASRHDVARLVARPRMALGGEIWSTGVHDLPGGVRIQTPREVRLQMARQGWRRVTAVEVEGPPTIADEYIARVGLELSDGLLWFYRFGMDDLVPLSERHRCIEAVIEGYFAREHVLALPLLQHHAAAPRHALHVAICAQNFGASELLVEAAADVSARQPERLADHEPELVVDLVAYASPGAASRIGQAATAYSAPSPLAKPPPLSDLVEEARRGRTSQWFRNEVTEILSTRD